MTGKRDFVRGLLILIIAGTVSILFASTVFDALFGTISTIFFYLILLVIVILLYILLLKRETLDKEAWTSIILVIAIISVVLYIFKGIIPGDILGSIREPMNFLQSIITTG